MVFGYWKKQYTYQRIIIIKELFSSQILMKFQKYINDITLIGCKQKYLWYYI